jgi:ATP-dependent exoDNAse (exonuclease V) beta subunit
VLAKQDPFANAEERRLFYVSITRAKKHVYLIAEDRYASSTFISEIQQNGYEITISRRRGKDSKLPTMQDWQNSPANGRIRRIPFMQQLPILRIYTKKMP